MEHLSLNDSNSRGSGGTPVLGGLPRQQNPQLPPQMFTTAAQLLDMTDKKLMVALRDGRKLFGTLRSWDQFANLVLQSTVERIFVPPSSLAGMQTTSPIEREYGLYADIPRGVFIVRGENVLLLGEVDLDKDDDIPLGYNLADVELVLRLTKERKIIEAHKEKIRSRKLRKIGFECENAGETSI